MEFAFLQKRGSAHAASEVFLFNLLLMVLMEGLQ